MARVSRDRKQHRIEPDLRQRRLASKRKHVFELSQLDIWHIPDLKTRGMLKLLDNRMEGTVRVVWRALILDLEVRDIETVAQALADA